MVDILVRNVDDEVARRLKDKAAASGRSLSETAKEALQRFVMPGKSERLVEVDRIRAMSPCSDVDSTALIREDRDNDEPYR
jgi:plasmid stability protein